MWSAIQKAYYWFWHDVCKRPEPFTDTMRRSAKETPMGIGVGWWLLVTHLWGIL